MTNKQIYSLYDNLSFLMKDCTKNLPVKIAYPIVRNYKQFYDIMQDLQIMRQQIIDKYGKPSLEKEGYYIAKEGYEDQFKNEIQGLDEIDNDIKIYKIKFKDLEPLELSLQDLDALYFMIEDEGEN